MSLDSAPALSGEGRFQQLWFGVTMGIPGWFGWDPSHHGQGHLHHPRVLQVLSSPALDISGMGNEISWAQVLHLGSSAQLWV